MKEKLNISFSGGRTSGYMTKLLLDNWSDRYDFIVTFANTGLEHPKTLEFVHNCDVHFGFNTVWLESDVQHGMRVGTKHKVVTYETACRNGDVFEDCIKKYGIPNTSYLHCTRELKLAPMQTYLKSIGEDWKTITTAIGIRKDEMRRVKNTKNIIYPLVDTWPCDKQDVLDWWEDQPFDLGIDEFEGNCQGCFKKSIKKHFMQIERDPSVYDFHHRMESTYGTVKADKGQRFFFRNNMSTNQLFAAYQENGGNFRRMSDAETSGGCSESCEVYETEELPGWLTGQTDLFGSRL
jgi:hypothetical protein